MVSFSVRHHKLWYCSRMIFLSSSVLVILLSIVVALFWNSFKIESQNLYSSYFPDNYFDAREVLQKNLKKTFLPRNDVHPFRRNSSY